MRDVDAVLDFWEGLLNGGGEVEIARARMDASDVRALCAEIRKVREERDAAREMTPGDYIRTVRVRSGISLAWLADAAGVDHVRLAGCELGVADLTDKELAFVGLALNEEGGKHSQLLHEIAGRENSMREVGL